MDKPLLIKQISIIKFLDKPLLIEQISIRFLDKPLLIKQISIIKFLDKPLVIIIKNNFDLYCTRMLQAILNKSWKQHPMKPQLYGHLPPIYKKNPSKMDKTCSTLLEKPRQTHKWHSSMDPSTWTCQSWSTSKNSVQSQDEVWKTCQEQWIIGMDR